LNRFIGGTSPSSPGRCRQLAADMLRNNARPWNIDKAQSAAFRRLERARSHVRESNVHGAAPPFFFPLPVGRASNPGNAFTTHSCRGRYAGPAYDDGFLWRVHIT